MFQFLFRAAGSVFLAIALVAAVLDVTRSVAASAIVLTPAGTSWEKLSPDSLQSFQAMIESNLGAVFWDPVMLKILSIPGWLLVWFIAMILLWIGQRRENPYGRFASR